MTKPLVNTIILSAAAVMAGCSVTTDRSGSAEVSDFVIDQTIKSASQCYAFADSAIDINGYACISASVMWPDKLGDSPIRHLQDSLIARAFASVPAGQGIDSAIKKFVSTPEVFSLDNAKWTRVDSIPANDAGNSAYYLDMTARVTYLDENMVTYQITGSSYTGGAHPNTSMDIFTYDLKTGRVLGKSDMFIAGSEGKLLEIVKQQLAEDLKAPVDKLSEAGIFVDQLNNIGEPYLNGESVVFHYNPYDIAPYYMGSIDVSVWASTIQQYLTPEVKALIAQ